MRFSSFLILVAVLCAFGGIQAWIVKERFVDPVRFETHSAVITGTQTDVGTPVSGILSDVAVGEDQRVFRGQTMFVIIPQSPTQPQGGAPVIITAQRDGVVTDVAATLGGYVGPNERLARIVDNSPDGLTVAASMPMPAQYLPDIRSALPAVISADFLDQPVAAVVTSVDPEYDAARQSIDLRLRLLELPSEIVDVPVGVPVTVTLELENRSALRASLARWSGDERVRDFFRRFAVRSVPSSNASPLR